jgi:hypothetical protein
MSDSKDWNVAERETHMRDNPTLDECAAMGATHYAYGWAPNPWGHWSDERKAAYVKGFEEARRKDKSA